MIIVTGMHRSGTSCIAGLLSLCGFSLGASYPLLNESRFDNQKGHFENLAVVSINERILRSAGGSWNNPPSHEKIFEASKAYTEEIRRFSETFDGFLIKDPRICLTVSQWEKLCASRLEAVVLCLRHPMSVSMSLLKRNDIPIEAGLELWARYNSAIMKGISKTPLVVVDYDNLNPNLYFELGSLMAALNRALPVEELTELTKGFYSEALNHAPFEQYGDSHLPRHIEVLYHTIRVKTFSIKEKEGGSTSASFI